MLYPHRGFGWVTSSVALASALITSSAGAAPALRVQTTQHGDFLMIGNTLGQECLAGTPAPVVGTVGSCGANTGDTSPDIFWRSEAPGAGQASANNTITVAQARSTALLSIPAGARVTHAFVYWGATLSSAGVDMTATMDRPGGFTSSLSATETWMSANNSYAAISDVTALVQTHGSGAYRMSGIDVQTLPDLNSNNAFAGWWMIVLYERASDPLRTLAISDGLDVVSNGNPQNVALSGFLVPASGFAGRLGVATFEGDSTIAGDQLFFNGGAALTDGQNPANNFFNGTRSSLGAAVSVAGDLPQLTGTPGSMSGIDLDIVDITGRLSAGLTSAPLTASSTGDNFYLASFVTSISTFAPEYGTSTKTAVDVNGGELLPGDEILYTLTFTNTGNDASVGTLVTDVLPLGVTYVSGSLSVLSGANVGPKSDAAGDDQGEYNAATRTVTTRIGTGANSTMGGAIAADGVSAISFRVRVDVGTTGVVANQGRVTGSGMLGGGMFSALTDGNAMRAGIQTTDVFVEGCSTDANCAAPTPRCDTAPTPNVCVACLTNADCSALTPVCAAGACTCVPSGAEVCDGRDNDCNGMIDEGDPGGGMGCTSSLPGVCAPGTTRCMMGISQCIANIAAGTMPEVCDRLDNDCDGVVNNGDPGGGMSCDSGMPGACAAGLTMCAADGIACVAQVLPGVRTETCNAVDDDCNGTVDDGFNVGMACSAGVGACMTTGMIACTAEMTARCNAVAGSPSMEVCSNDIDEDCDGMLNNGCGTDAGPIVVDAAVSGDAGMPDAGTRDAGYVPPDAARAGDAGTTIGFTGGACGCSTAGRGTWRWSPVALGLLALGITRRRRTARKSA
jgi:uncharacterized repeat protein (TIGR01451 family)